MTPVVGYPLYEELVEVRSSSGSQLPLLWSCDGVYRAEGIVS